MIDMDIHLKKEFLQFTGSFKERGARYALLMLTEEQKKKGVISASLGNHAQVRYYLWLSLPEMVSGGYFDGKASWCSMMFLHK